MGATFFLKDLPNKKKIRDFAKRYPQLDPSAVEPLLALLKTASEVTARVDAQLARWGISYGKFCLLMQLNVEGTLSPSDLAERMGVTRATVTGLLDGLERAGLVRRERLGGGDRRSLRVSLTPRGQGRLDEFLPGHYRRVSGLMADLSAPERKTLAGLLLKVLGGVAALERP